jgi:hypothetical protein
MNRFHRCFGTASVLAVCGAVVLAGCGSQGSAGGAAAASGAKCSASPKLLVDLDALVTTLHATEISSSFVAVDSTNVFFAFGGSLLRAPLRGGPPVVLAPVDPAYFGVLLVTSMGIVYELSAAGRPNGSIARVSTAGGTPVTLATTSGEPGPIATDDTSVYFADGASIESVPLTGGVAPHTLAVLPDGQGMQVQPVTGLAVVGSQLVITEASGIVADLPLQGGSLQTLATDQANARFPMSCGSDTCWWTGPTPAGVAGTQGPGSIERLSHGSETTITGAPYLPWSLAFDGTSFFETVACDICSGTLMRIPASGNKPVTMAAGGFVAVDDTCAYYSVVSGLTGNGIYSVDKSYDGPPPAL